MLEALQVLANRDDVSYQSLIKLFLADRIRREHGAAQQADGADRLLRRSCAEQKERRLPARVVVARAVVGSDVVRIPWQGHRIRVTMNPASAGHADR